MEWQEIQLVGGNLGQLLNVYSCIVASQQWAIEVEPVNTQNSLVHHLMQFHRMWHCGQDEVGYVQLLIISYSSGFRDMRADRQADVCITILSTQSQVKQKQTNVNKSFPKSITNRVFLSPGWRMHSPTACASCSCAECHGALTESYGTITKIISASLSISIASRALMVRNIRLTHLSVGRSASKLWQNGWLHPDAVCGGNT